MNKTSKHQQELWKRFTKSGSVYDYLAYKGIQAVETDIKNSDQNQIP